MAGGEIRSGGRQITKVLETVVRALSSILMETESRSRVLN